MIFIDTLDNLNPRLTTFIGCFLGFILIGDLNAYEQNSLGNFLELVGQVLLANAAQQSLVFSRMNKTVGLNNPKVKEIYNPLIYDIDKLKEILTLFNKDQTKETLNMLTKSLNTMDDVLERLKKET